MDGIHDFGGKEGYGRVKPVGDEPPFDEAWEAKVYAMLGAARRAGALKNTDQFRHAIERIVPAAYLTHGYYGRWLGALETLLVEAGVLTTEEINRKVAEKSRASAAVLVAAQPRLDPELVPYDSAQAHSARSLDRAPRFRPGDRVRTLTHGVPGHTRLPQYARGKLGTIALYHEGWVYPDTNAHGKGEEPQALYTVSFDGRELWGPDAEPGLAVNIDLFEPYLRTA